MCDIYIKNLRNVSRNYTIILSVSCLICYHIFVQNESIFLSYLPNSCPPSVKGRFNCKECTLLHIYITVVTRGRIRIYTEFMLTCLTY